MASDELPVLIRQGCIEVFVVVCGIGFLQFVGRTSRLLLILTDQFSSFFLNVLNHRLLSDYDALFHQFSFFP